MLDGLYQSVICFYMTYLLYSPGQSVTENGLDLSDMRRMGIFVACSAVVASNTYIIMNTYRWDWLTVLINAVSSLLFWFWTGVYSAVPDSGQFYNAGTEVFGNLTFWALSLLTVTICLAPRLAINAMQKVYAPYDVDIIREQVTQGKFKYLEEYDAYVPPKLEATSPSDSDGGKTVEVVDAKRSRDMPDDERPIYPPSVAPTTTTHNHRSQSGSDQTRYTNSLEFRRQQHHQSLDRIRDSFEQPRFSVDKVRSSFEASNDFTSAAMLARMEASHGPDGRPVHPNY